MHRNILVRWLDLIHIENLREKFMLILCIIGVYGEIIDDILALDSLAA